MKLISLNVEGKKHLDSVYPFLNNEDADTVCLTEAPESILDWLESSGYISTFAPMCIKFHDGQSYKEGIVVSTKKPHTAETLPYYVPANDIQVYDHSNRRQTQRHILLFSKIGDINIAQTHFTWNPVGEIADENQKLDMKSMLNILGDKPPHILCGDLNIPRNINNLYDVLVKKYIDNIPPEYKTSLDKNLHRHSDNPKLQKIFTDFMVDYLFTQSPISASNTKLVFGVSDHAAVVTNVLIK
jgi:exonuclease III